MYVAFVYVNARLSAEAEDSKHIKLIVLEDTHRNGNEHPHRDTPKEETSFTTDESSYDLSI